MLWPVGLKSQGPYTKSLHQVNTKISVPFLFFNSSPSSGLISPVYLRPELWLRLPKLVPLLPQEPGKRSGG